MSYSLNRTIALLESGQPIYYVGGHTGDVLTYEQGQQDARERVFAACRARGIAFLETCTPESIRRKIDEGVRVIAGHREETARVGRAHTQRMMPV